MVEVGFFLTHISPWILKLFKTQEHSYGSKSCQMLFIMSSVRWCVQSQKRTFLGFTPSHPISMIKTKGCTREFLYIRNSHPQLKLALLAENCTAGMYVNTDSCPLRTQKLTVIHGFLPRLTLTSEGGEWLKRSKEEIFVIWFVHENWTILCQIPIYFSQ